MKRKSMQKLMYMVLVIVRGSMKSSKIFETF